MMTSSEIELVYVIKRFVINIDFNLSDYENTMQTLRKVEKTYWQYCCHVPQYPKITFSQYFRHVCYLFGKEWNYENYVMIKSQYNYYKKSIPTAGAMIHYHENNTIYLLLVKNNRAKVFSLPKGKQEKNENVKQTAIREVMEETGIDISEYINSNDSLCDTTNISSDSSENDEMVDNVKSDKDGVPPLEYLQKNYTATNELNKYYICKSTIYDIKMKTKQQEFKGYDDEEIVDIVWTPLSTIMNSPQFYSRQVKTAAQILNDKYTFC